MPSIFFEGRTYYVPGVYTTTKVASGLPGPLPAFHIPVILGAGFDGHPYDADTKKVTGENEFTPFKLVQTTEAAAAYYGEESEIARGMRVAKRHGLPFAYVACLNPLTRGSIVATSTGPVNQFTMYPRKFGPIGTFHKIKWDGTTFTVTKVKRYALLNANASNTATRLYLKGRHDWLTVGATISVGSTAVAMVSRTITAAGQEITALGQINYWIEVDTTPAAALNTSAYALVCQYDVDRLEVSTGTTIATGQNFIDYLNNISQTFVAVKHADYTGALPANIASSTPIKEVSAWGTVANGSAPAFTSSDVTAFVALMNASAWAKFCIREQVLPQTYLLLSSDATSQGVMRDYAVAEDTRGFPISVTAGCAWGDMSTTASDVTNPGFRAASLNNMDVMECALGADYEAAYLSMAPAYFGRRVAGGPGHNITNDELIFSTWEGAWDEINSGQLTYLCKKGVATAKLSVGQSIRYRCSQGLSTLQANNGLIWNSDGTTWSVMQRDLANFIDRVLKVDFEENAIGADRVDANALASILTRRAEVSLEKRGYITSFTINSITLNDGANGWDVAWSVTLPVTTDFITFTTTILVGGA